MEFRRCEMPLPRNLGEEFLIVCERAFECAFDGLRPVINGDEQAENFDVVYLAIEDNTIVASSHLTASNRMSAIGGLGEVVTDPRYRGRGLASHLCQLALEEFKARCGQAVFLATENPAAARIYHRLGWRRLPNTNVMACVTSGNSPEEFLVDYFRAAASPVTIHKMTSDERIPLIPLLATPHNWQILDANTKLYSTRHVTMTSCMGLYPRFSRLMKGGGGEAWAAHSQNGHLVGCATVIADSSSPSENSAEAVARIDGFVHDRFKDSWPKLIQTAIRSSEATKAKTLTSVVSIEDEEKRQLFESLRFQESGRGDAFDLSGRRVESVQLSRL